MPFTLARKLVNIVFGAAQHIVSKTPVLSVLATIPAAIVTINNLRTSRRSRWDFLPFITLAWFLTQGTLSRQPESIQPDMEASEENKNMRTSQLRQPTRIPSPGKGLSDMSDSQTNSRSTSASRMPPPPTLKHKTSEVAEPEPKRTSLAERAGASNRSIVAPTPVRPPVRPINLVTASKTMTRTTSYTSTVSRPPSAASRNFSSGSFSSSVGHGRSQSFNNNRANATHTQPVRKTSGLPRTRPATATGFHSQEVEVDTSKENIAWNVSERLDRMEGMYTNLKDTLQSSYSERSTLENELVEYRKQVINSEAASARLLQSNSSLQNSLDEMREKSETLQQKLATANTTLDDQTRSYRLAQDDLERQHRNEFDKVRREHTDELDRVIRLHMAEMREIERKAANELEDRVRELEKRHEAQLEEERNRRVREVQAFETKLSTESENLDIEIQQKDRENKNLREEIESLRKDLNREQILIAEAKSDIADMASRQKKTDAETSATIKSQESIMASLRAKIIFLESGSKAQSDSFAAMESRMQDAVRSAELSKQKLIKEESIRRILFNQVQELKGNIRVMCRIRPAPVQNLDAIVKVSYPDQDKQGKEIELVGKEEKSSLGTVTRKTHAFSFDKVFGPESQNQEVFSEISQLVQSALDGYNVCIFCYGQTGSGKTHTMSSADGMIPRATQQIYQSATELQEKGWTYTMEGNFVEVYNEDINDLLGDSKDMDKKKHEIRHDDKKKQTTITGLQTVALDSPTAVETILIRADANRSVAATKSNERSSRSHSVFILKLVGRNSTTGETSEGTLNLVDLAGSERLKSSGAEGERMKETQNINKSLSCLGDVIAALGQGKEGGHIPYRNSKLTYLLQYSLGGNSKTLMFVMASPMEAHLTETVTSLKFATKVYNTHIGTAKKSIKVRE